MIRQIRVTGANCLMDKIRCSKLKFNYIVVLLGSYLDLRRGIMVSLSTLVLSVGLANLQKSHASFASRTRLKGQLCGGKTSDSIYGYHH